MTSMQKDAIRDKYPHYQKAFEAYIAGNGQKFERLRKASKLSIPEKRLHEARSLYVKRRNDLVITLIKDAQYTAHPFLEAERMIILGNAYMFQGDWQLSFIHNQNATLIYKEVEDSRGLFISHYNLSVSANRLGLLTISDHHLEIARKYAKSNNQKSLVLRALSCRESKRENYVGAIHYIEEALALTDLMPVDQLVLESISADIYFRAGELTKARNALLSIHRSKLNQEKPRSLLDLYLLDVLDQDLKLKNAPKTIRESGEYSLKWEFIKAIQCEDQPRVEELWAKLHNKQPEYYLKEKFKVKLESDSKTIFMTAVQKLTKNAPAKGEKVITSNINNIKENSKLATLYSLLGSNSNGLDKYELIESLWGEYNMNYESRFYKLIQRLKQKTTDRIVNTNGRYVLIAAKTNVSYS